MSQQTGFRFQGEDLASLFDVSGTVGIVSADTNFTANDIDVRHNFMIYQNVRASSTNFFKGTTDLNQFFQSGLKFFNIYYENMTVYQQSINGIMTTFFEATNSSSKFIYNFAPESNLTNEEKTNNPNATASILLLGGGGGGSRPNCRLQYRNIFWNDYWSNQLGGGGGAGTMGEATNYNLPMNKLITSTVGSGGGGNGSGGNSTLVIDGTTVATAYGGTNNHRISGQNYGSGAGARGAGWRDEGSNCGLRHGAVNTTSQVGNKGTNNDTTYGSFTFYANRGGNTGTYDVNDATKVSGAGGGGGAGGVGGDRRVINGVYGYGGHGGSGRTWINGVTYAGGGGGAAAAGNVIYHHGGSGGSGIGGGAGRNYDKVWTSWVAYFSVNTVYSGPGGNASPANRGSGGGGALHAAEGNNAGNGSAGITIYAIPQSMIKNSYAWNTASNPYFLTTVKSTDNTVTTSTYNGVQYNIYAFTSSTSNLMLETSDSSITSVSGIHILLVGGGGAGGGMHHSGSWLLGGGGGAGGYGELGGSSGITLPTNTSISFTIGAGGDRAVNYDQYLNGRNETNDRRMYSGSSTRFEVGGTWIASAYGGVGAGQNTYSGSNGGSGAGQHGVKNGGGAYGNSTGGLAGGITNDTTYGSFTFWANAGGSGNTSAGGGGGAGGPGGNGGGGYGNHGGNGGSAKNWYINNLTYAGGGGGGKWARTDTNPSVTGGAGGGGVGGAGANVYFDVYGNLTNATTAGNAMANRGGGGGGRGCCGGAGGSGVALVAIPTASVAGSDPL